MCVHLYQSKRLHGKFIIKVHLRDIFILLKFWQHVGLAVSSLIALNDREKKQAWEPKKFGSSWDRWYYKHWVSEFLSWQNRGGRKREVIDLFWISTQSLEYSNLTPRDKRKTVNSIQLQFFHCETPYFLMKHYDSRQYASMAVFHTVLESVHCLSDVQRKLT